jgi:hypothetical protein
VCTNPGVVHVDYDAQQRDQGRWDAPVNGVGLDSLSREESLLLLLSSLPIGRLVYIRRALPAVELVNFAISNGEIVIPPGAGGTLAAAVRGNVVAFEADAVDAATRSAWSVTVIGRSRQVSDPGETSRLRRLPLATWLPGEKDHFICISIDIVNGRRLRPSHHRPLPG